MTLADSMVENVHTLEYVDVTHSSKASSSEGISVMDIVGTTMLVGLTTEEFVGICKVRS